MIYLLRTLEFTSKCFNMKNIPCWRWKWRGPSKYCPGNYSKCCPKVGSTKKSVSMEDDYNNIIAQGNSESSYFTTGGEEIALGLGTTNPNDWTIPPLDGENLYLSNEGTANEGTDQYGLIAGLGDSSGWGDEGTAWLTVSTKSCFLAVCRISKDCCERIEGWKDFLSFFRLSLRIFDILVSFETRIFGQI